MNSLKSCVFFSLLIYAAGFQAIQQKYWERQTTKTPRGGRLNLAKTTEGQDDFPPEEEFSDEYSGTVDWDAEWKKVVANEGKSSGDRPGKNYYKSEAEIAAIKAVNKASEKAADIGSSVSNAMPDIRSLSGDWKFWIGILAIISVGISVLSAPSNIPTNIPPGGSNDSYYI